MVDDDDIDRLIDRIDTLIDVFTGMASGGSGESDEGSKSGSIRGDLYKEGSISSGVTTIEEYIEERHKSAVSEEVTLPFYRGDKYTNSEFYSNLVISDAENLEATRLQLSDSDWDKFFREYAKEALSILTNESLYPNLYIERKVVGDAENIRESLSHVDLYIDIVKPRSSRFGVIPTGYDSINVVMADSPFGYIKIYGSHWFGGVGGNQLSTEEIITQNILKNISPEDYEYLESGKDPIKLVLDLKMDAKESDKTSEQKRKLDKIPDTLYEKEGGEDITVEEPGADVESKKEWIKKGMEKHKTSEDGSRGGGSSDGGVFNDEELNELYSKAQADNINKDITDEEIKEKYPEPILKRLEKKTNYNIP